MHVVIRWSFSASRLPARSIAGSRVRHSTTRNLHSSRATRLSIIPPTDPSNPKPENTADPSDQDRQDVRQSAPSNTIDLASIAQSVAEGKDSRSTSNGNHRTRERSSDHGSFSSRSQRNSKPDGIPPVVIPDWFLSRNIRLKEDKQDLTQGTLQIVSESGNVHRVEKGRKLEKSIESADAQAKSESAQESPVYQLSEVMWDEIATSTMTGLYLSGSDASESFSARKSHLKLHCPVDGGIYFLDKIVEQLAQRAGADLVRLDAQDLAQIGGDYIRESSDASSNSIWSLGYDSQQVISRSSDRESEEDIEDGEAETVDEMEEEDPSHARPPANNMRGPWHHISSATMIPVGIGSNLGELRKMAEKAIASLNSGAVSNGNRSNGRNSLPSAIFSSSPSRPWHEQKLTTLFESLIDVPMLKRGHIFAATSPDHMNVAIPLQMPSILTTDDRNHFASKKDVSSTESSAPASTKTIILVRDHKDISATQQGGYMLDKLIDVIQNRRKRGESVLLVGTTSSTELTPELSAAAIEHLQSEGEDSLYRTVFVTPNAPGPSGGLYDREECRRIREINLRNLQDLVRRVEPSLVQELAISSSGLLDLYFSNEHAELSTKLDEQLMTFDEIHRIVITAIGYRLDDQRQKGRKVPLKSEHIVNAMALLELSDETKADWVSKERELQTPPRDAERLKATPNDTRLKKLRRTSSRHERQLLRGVINPENIRTTFDDVHAPPETIEALKTLTSLSLTRPDAFKYGVLATDKISGLLLYGPPGTGKTLLAKAVAKESGATVLEVSGSEVYDMYVGESEKNVKAIFSLAKKLSPCVVFIDEADAIFGSRGSGTQRTTHRELINQFLREWDGMNELSAFIMVATNRPFDLDDAVLRRLPRRLLVDLPVESDREAILEIHLKDETLDPSISLTKLAADTPLYSGSDLKNLAVAAALACVREESETAAAEQKGDKPHVYPEKRILMQRHFDKAMEEISASVNEDMSSLGAIRKFDEKYGDRRGRRKKQGYGFITGGGEREADAARVRS